ncbi:MAG: type II toxin-antitoxin system death-on-curing family toxin [Pyrinomonadaceae bacterium MAG19_C2-C3]|nr:type II toxin-antitoxin system death-on-curing family toxin [Pyrinomonadaceae bacterium MAG19_C2-C3]
MKEPKFLQVSDVMILHAESIAEFGGSYGLRDEGALQSAVLAAETRHHYEDADLATCAATYAYHISQAHAFVDGNKRAAAAAATVFLDTNGARINADDDEIYQMFLHIAAGEMTRDEVEAKFAEWFVEDTKN